MTLSANKQWFERNGKPFFWLADTWWYGLTDRADLVDFKRLVQLRKQQGFTVILLVVGVPPEVDFWSTAAHAGGEHPFLPDYQPNPLYFDAIESKIAHLVESGLVPCLVGGWGPHIRQVGTRNMQVFWQLMIERLGKYHPVWCLCGEVDLIHSPSPAVQSQLTQLPQLISKITRKLYHYIAQPLQAAHLHTQLQDWQIVGRFIKRTDPNHLLIAHPHSTSTTDELFNDPDWLDATTIQSGHDHGRAGFLAAAPLKHLKYKHHKPFINLEPWYEGIHGSFGEQDQRYAFYCSVLAGAKGHTYGADGLWNMRTKADRFLGHWGDQDWQTASTLLGARQLGLGKRWFEKFPWWLLQPQPAAIKPHWTTADAQQPLCAQLPDESYLCYLPQISSEYDWGGRSARHITWIDPSTLKKIDAKSTICNDALIHLA